MKSPLDLGAWQIVEEAGSTQDLAARALLEGETPGVIQTRHQTSGRGRLGRVWHTGPDEALTYSLLFHAYPDHPRPYLLGMAVGLAAAQCLDLKLRWPNDLNLNGRKIGGILTEVLPDRSGRRITVVGLGLNLNQRAFPPEIAAIATSLYLERGEPLIPEAVGREILERMRILPEPHYWTDIEELWAPYDATPGKEYRLADGRIVTARRIGPDGELVGTLDGSEMRVLAAEAILGSN